jgi:ankyrin repeat protein
VTLLLCATECDSSTLRSRQSKEPHLANLMRRLFFRNAWLADEPELIRAAALGKVRLVHRLLKAGESPTQLSPDGNWSALHAAATRRHPRVVALLLAAGVPADLECSDGNTPLLNAAGHGDVQSVRLLLAAGADPARRDYRFDWQPLDRAADYDNAPVARLLIAAGVDVNRSDDTGFTPLMTAAESGSPRVVRILLASGADPQVTVPPEHEDAGMTAAELARRMADGTTRARYRRNFLRVAELVESWRGTN